MVIFHRIYTPSLSKGSKMNSPAPKVPARILGGPPGNFQEWDGNHGVRGNGKARETNDSEIENSISLPSIYGGFDVPLCGPQYGFSSLALRQQTSSAVEGSRTQAEILPLEASQPRGFTFQQSKSSQPGPTYSKKVDGSTFKCVDKIFNRRGIILTCSEIRYENLITLSHHPESYLSDHQAPMKQYRLPREM